MTIYERVSVNRNGRALQIYLPLQLVSDSRFPLAPGDECIAQVTAGGGLLVMPIERLDELPITVDAPPPDHLFADDRLNHPEPATDD